MIDHLAALVGANPNAKFDFKLVGGAYFTHRVTSVDKVGVASQYAEDTVPFFIPWTSISTLSYNPEQ